MTPGQRSFLAAAMLVTPGTSGYIGVMSLFRSAPGGRRHFPLPRYCLFKRWARVKNAAAAISHIYSGQLWLGAALANLSSTMPLSLAARVVAI